MARERFPAFQFYPKDFLSDENQVAMSLVEVGAYIRLMSVCWNEGSLPADMRKLGKLCGATMGQMTRMWAALQPCFRPHPSEVGRLVHPRLEKERAKQATYADKMARNGKQGGGVPRASRDHASEAAPCVVYDTPPQNINDSTDSESRGLADAKPNRSIADPILQSADCNVELVPSSQVPAPAPARRRGVTGSGVMAGALQRDHLRHSWCGERICVPEFLHARFVRAIGGDHADVQLKAFYRETTQAIPDSQPIESDPVKFWSPLVSSRWPPHDTQVGTRTAALQRASAGFLAGLRK